MTYGRGGVCDNVTGNLWIQGSDIVDLDGLADLTSIGDDLTVTTNTNLSNINGLAVDLHARLTHICIFTYPTSIQELLHIFKLLEFNCRAIFGAKVVQYSMQINSLALQGTELANAYVGTLRLKLLKNGAVILRNTQRYNAFSSFSLHTSQRIIAPLKVVHETGGKPRNGHSVPLSN